nr:hypothetical protein GCM10010200_058250 [Actinomadura rugatobispora]
MVGSADGSAKQAPAPEPTRTAQPAAEITRRTRERAGSRRPRRSDLKLIGTFTVPP